MTDIAGPASALNAVTSRPSDGRNFGALDSFFKDCTTPSSQDGTQVAAAWLNQVTGFFRNLIRVNGLKADGITPVVAYDQTDNMVLSGIQQMVQRGLLNYGPDTGSVNNIILALEATPAELIPGMSITFKALTAPTGPATAIISGFPAYPIQRRGGLALVGGDWAIGDMISMRYVGGAYQLSGLVLSDIQALLSNQVILCSADTGSANAIVCASSAPTISAFAPGQLFLIKKSASANTGAVTFAVDGVTAIPVVSRTGNAMTSGDLPASEQFLAAINSAGTALTHLSMVSSDVTALIGASYVQNIFNTAIQISTAVTKNIGPSGDFTTLAAAMAWLTQFLITSTGSVTFNIAAGVMNISGAPVNIDHPNASQVTFQGAALTGSITGSTFPNTGSRSGDAATALTNLRAIYATELHFTSTGGYGLICPNGHPTIKNILATGDGTGSAATSGLLLGNGAQMQNVSIHGFAGAGINVTSGTLGVLGNSVTATYNGVCGISSSNGAAVQQNGNVYGYYNGTYGIQIVNGGNWAAPSGIGIVSCVENASDGVHIFPGGQMTCSASSVFSSNGNDGIYIADGGTFSAPSCAVAQNTAAGLAAQNCKANVAGATFASNGGNAIGANYGADVNALGASGVSGHASPAINTVGNNNSYITN